MNSETTIYDIARAFGEETSRSIFITGKAGTGKTTFLHNLRKATHKQMVITAPTGVAAINAEGTTLHSFFQLPLSPFAPTPEGRRELISKLKLKSNKRQIIRQLEVLVIDEISMVRADLLDEIDTILRHIRRRFNEPYGGVQVIYIGDMYQLPPVVVPEEWNLLSAFYPTPYFFDSYVVHEQPPIYIELDKIFRQKDTNFIQLLNEVRNNQVTENSFRLLQSRYLPTFELKKHKNYILLTTHNAKAMHINMEELNRIHQPEFTFSATIEGEFPERNYPNDAVLTLKKGARVMFIANDTEFPRRYFNGKMGTISYLSSDEIKVVTDDEGEEIKVKLEIWRNVRYNFDKKNGQIKEEELGTYIQFPLRLAWAITIHKSQGLTFDKAVIDAEDSFSAGQVYVALSRCRNLDGIILSSPIPRHCIQTEQSIAEFARQKTDVETLDKLLDTARKEFNMQMLASVFNFQREAALIEEFQQFLFDNKIHISDAGREHATELQNEIYRLQTIGLKFTLQLHDLYKISDLQKLKERLKAANDYFDKELKTIKQKVTHTPAEISDKTTAKEYTENLKNIHTELCFRQVVIAGMAQDATPKNYYKIRDDFRVPAFKLQSENMLAKVVRKLKEKKNNIEKNDSAQISFDLYKKGKTIDEIAKIRELTTGTIESHLTQFITSGAIPIADFVAPEWQTAISEMLNIEGIKLSEIYDALEGNVTYAQIRMVKAVKEKRNSQ